jgi:hypothetical protein
MPQANVAEAAGSALRCIEFAVEIHRYILEHLASGQDLPFHADRLIRMMRMAIANRIATKRELNNWLPRLDYSAPATDEQVGLTSALHQDIARIQGRPGITFLKAAFAAPRRTPVQGWDDSTSPTAHESAVKMVEVALSLPVVGSGLAAPVRRLRFQKHHRAAIKENFLASHQVIRCRALELPDPIPIARVLRAGVQAEYDGVQSVLAAWKGQEQGAASPRRDEEKLGSQPEATYVFKVIGNVWEVRYGEEFGRFKDSVGMGYIHALLAMPGHTISARSLALEEDAQARVANRQDGIDYPDPMTLPVNEPMLDPPAQAQILARMRQLQDDLEIAQETDARERLEKIQEEYDSLRREVGATTFQGRRRLFPDQDQKARSAVRMALTRAYRQMAKGKPPLKKLVAHLRSSIQTEGTSYAYCPGSPAPAWDL